MTKEEILIEMEAYMLAGECYHCSKINNYTRRCPVCESELNDRSKDLLKELKELLEQL